jgi:hypothetical protein
VRRRAVTLAPRPGSRRRNARAQRIPHAGRTPAHPGGMPAHSGRRNARAPRRARCPRTQAGETPAHPGRRDARAPRRLVTPAPRQVHAGAMPAASALGTRASGAHASEDAPPVRRRAVTLAPRPGSRRRDARAPPGSRRRDARSVCPGYARLRRACQRGCASSAQAGSDARASSRLTQAQRPRPADTLTRAGRPRSQAGEMPAHPGGRDARAPRQARCPRTQAGEMPRTRRIMSQPSTTRFSLLQSQIEPGALLRRQTHLQRNQVGGEFLRRAAPYQRIDIEWLAQHIRQGDLRDA